MSNANESPITDPAEIHFKTAWQHRKFKRYPEAIAEFKKSLEIQPEKAATHFNLGLMYEAIDDIEQAWKYGTRAMELFSEQGNEKHRRTAEDFLRKLRRRFPEFEPK
jgi:tetratricopeptide (TPR) repeat protein